MSLHQRIYRNLKGVKRPKSKGPVLKAIESRKQEKQNLKRFHTPTVLDREGGYQHTFGSKMNLNESKYEYKHEFKDKADASGQPTKKLKLGKTGYLKGGRIVAPEKVEHEQNVKQLMKDAKARQEAAKPTKGEKS